MESYLFHTRRPIQSINQSLDWFLYKLLHSGVFLIHSLKRSGSKESESQKVFIGEAYYTGWAALVEECRHWKIFGTECQDDFWFQDICSHFWKRISRNTSYLCKSLCSSSWAHYFGQHLDFWKTLHSWIVEFPLPEMSVQEYVHLCVYK